MAATLSTDIRMSVGWGFRDALDLSSVQDSSKSEYGTNSLLNLPTGTGASQADRIWHDRRTLAAAANDDLDLTALTNSIYGSTVTINLVKVKGIWILNKATIAAEDLIVGGGSNPFLGPLAGTTPTARCYANTPLAWLNIVSGWATSGSVKTLRINNAGAASNTYDIVIFGTSA